MSRTRTIYQNEALYVSKAESTSTTPLYIPRVQSVGFDYGLNLRDVNQFGELAAIDRINTENPNVNLSFTYLTNSFRQERLLGFYVLGDDSLYANSGQKPFLSNIISHPAKSRFDSRSYYLLIGNEGYDIAGTNSTAVNDKLLDIAAVQSGRVVGFGNAVINSYEAEGSVGNFPTVSIGIEALNVRAVINTLSTGSTVLAVARIPTINHSGELTNLSTSILVPLPNQSIADSYGASASAGGGYISDNVSVIRPGDITVTILDTNATAGLIEAAPNYDLSHVQSYRISHPIPRASIQSIDKKYAIERDVEFPLKVSVAIDVIVGGFSEANLFDSLDAGNTYNVSIKLTSPDFSADSLLRYDILGCSFDGFTSNGSIGPSKTATLNFSANISAKEAIEGGANNRGLFLSGNF